MPEPPRRKRFQLHLSTAIVMMFVAGGLMWANLQKRENELIGQGVYVSGSSVIYTESTKSWFLANEEGDYWAGSDYVYYGWPSEAINSVAPSLVMHNGTMLQMDDGVAQSNKAFKYVYPRYTTWHVNAILLNVLSAFGILSATWFLLEWLIRRRSVSK